MWRRRWDISGPHNARPRLLRLRGRQLGVNLWNCPPPTVDEVATAEFAEPLIRGVLEHRDDLDALMISHADNWDLNRMAVVDRNILRLAAYEMLHREDIPPVVSINEAVDIAKKFSTEESGRFVNGILDKICSELSRPTRTTIT